MRASFRLRVLLGAAVVSSIAAGSVGALVACGSSDDGTSGAKDASTDGTLGKTDSSPPGTDAASDAGPIDDATVSDADAGDAAADADAALALHRPFGLTHFIATGQSLSVGVDGTPLIDTTQPYHNVRISDDGSAPLYDGMGDKLALVPLIAPVRPTEGATLEYPHNIFGQTCNEPAANQVTALAMAADGKDYPVALSVVGESGQSITVIQKGGTGNAYASSMYEATALVGLAADAGATFGVGGIFLTHGETDTGDTTYEASLVKLQSDYQTDLQALTKQTDGVPLFLSQQCTEPGSAGATSASTIAEWKAAVDNPGKIVLVGSKYQYEYSTADHLHLIGPGYVALGEKYGEAYFQQVVLDRPWRPLAPASLTSATHTGAVITLNLDVAYPPLTLDPMLTTNHATGTYAAWAKGEGFEVSDSTGNLTIDSVAIAGSAVTITLDKAPTGTGLTLAYAMVQDGDGTQGGAVGGRHGALRDSDPFVGRDAEKISSTVTAGSATITAGTAGAKPFLARTTHDRVHDASGAEYIVTAHAADGSSVTVSPVWAGASGTVTLDYAHEQRNYLVQFSLPVQ
jgi:hypothetical protein